jgi:DNA processing protein
MARLECVRVLDREYPPELRELKQPPDPMWIRGEILPAPAVAIVGTRHPSRACERYAHDLAFRLAKSGVTVWSGGAVGIDAAAHRGALDAGGATIAVIGTGLDRCYPVEHAALYEEIVLAGGALVSPFERTQHAALHTFPRRNGVLAALTRATVLIEAPLKSGARSTARYARELHRPLFVVPTPPWHGARGAGNWAEVDHGAYILSNESPLFDLLQVPRPAPDPSESHSVGPTPTSHATTEGRPKQAVQQLSLECQMVLNALSSAPLHVDDLCVQSGLPAALVQAALLTLSLEAVLVEGPSGWFRRLNVGKDSG